MRKFSFILALFIGTIAIAQDGELPSKINDAFKKKFPNAKNVSWYLDTDAYKIEFTSSGNDYTGVFSSTGEWLETDKIISDMDIPGAIVSALNKKYPESEISYAEYIENNKGEKFYRINSYTENADYVIDITAEGKVLNEEKSEFNYDSE